MKINEPNLIQIIKNQNKVEKVIPPSNIQPQIYRTQQEHIDLFLTFSSLLELDEMKKRVDSTYNQTRLTQGNLYKNI